MNQKVQSMSQSSICGLENPMFFCGILIIVDRYAADKLDIIFFIPEGGQN